MGYTLGQAAKAVGLAKTTLSRAIEKGKLSATRTEDGRFDIDPAELHRVFQSAPPVTGPLHQYGPSALQSENRLLREMVDDLRRRLDASEEERRQLSVRLLPAPARRWWRWRR